MWSCWKWHDSPCGAFCGGRTARAPPISVRLRPSWLGRPARNGADQPAMERPSARFRSTPPPYEGNPPRRPPPGHGPCVRRVVVCKQAEVAPVGAVKAAGGMIGAMEPNLGATLDDLVQQALRCQVPTREQALTMLGSSDDDLLDVVAAGGRVRRHFFGNRVKLNLIINLKSGLCPENCSYCSQRSGSQADVLKYNWIDPAAAAETADRAAASGVKRICLVASGRGPSDRDISRVAETVLAVKEHHPDLEVCTSLGLLTAERAERLLAAGVSAYNHNLNTNEANYPRICSTHTFADRVDTVGVAHAAGLSPCSGAIFGMGETDDEVVDLAVDLRRLGVDSVPINFLIPLDRKSTRLN